MTPMNMLCRCRAADNVTWLGGMGNSRFQFHLSRELMSESAFVKVVCDVSFCRNASSAAGAGRLAVGDAIPQV